MTMESTEDGAASSSIYPRSEQCSIHSHSQLDDIAENIMRFRALAASNALDALRYATKFLTGTKDRDGYISQGQDRFREAGCVPTKAPRREHVPDSGDVRVSSGRLWGFQNLKPKTLNSLNSKSLDPKS